MLRCHDCGRSVERTFEYVDGRKTIRICQMCKAEREWRTAEPSDLIPPAPQKKSFFEKLRDFFKFK